ncbi:MAG TPA: PepSY domain-containing protein [Micromonosporaceae bacterium]|nr:PepSY domain-containing protein [Micromonosporaceae bacterium]
MRRRTKLIIVASAAAAVVAAAVTGTAVATGGVDTETPITGEAYNRAAAAALAYTGGGRVTETEVGDEDSYYEVEVTLADGRQVDVQLDANFHVIGSETDTREDGSD